MIHKGLDVKFKNSSDKFENKKYGKIKGRDMHINEVIDKAVNEIQCLLFFFSGQYKRRRS